jgi:hypothetical protein
MATAQQEAGPVAEDEAGFKRGRGTMLWALLLAAVVGLFGVWHLLSGGDDERVYGELGRKINGLRQAHFDQFWACALSGQNLHDLNSNTELMSQLDGRAAQGGKTYAVYLRDECLGKLTEIEPTLESLIIPDDLKPDVEALKTATGQLRSSCSAFVSYLDSPNPYDSDSAKPHLQAIAKAWFDYRQSQAALNKTLKSRLDHQG